MMLPVYKNLEALQVRALSPEEVLHPLAIHSPSPRHALSIVSIPSPSSLTKLSSGENAEDIRSKRETCSRGFSYCTNARGFSAEFQLVYRVSFEGTQLGQYPPASSSFCSQFMFHPIQLWIVTYNIYVRSRRKCYGCSASPS